MLRNQFEKIANYISAQSSRDVYIALVTCYRLNKKLVVIVTFVIGCKLKTMRGCTLSGNVFVRQSFVQH